MTDDGRVFGCVGPRSDMRAHAEDREIPPTVRNGLYLSGARAASERQRLGQIDGARFQIIAGPGEGLE